MNKRMESLKAICEMYGWKYDTVYKKWKRGLFVQGYRDPVGRLIRFNIADVDAWAHQSPVCVQNSNPSLLANEI